MKKENIIKILKKHLPLECFTDNTLQGISYIDNKTGESFYERIANDIINN